MIRNITSGYGIHISGSSSGSPYVDSTRPSAGMLRYVGNNIEVYDGSSWMPLQSSYPQIELSGDVLVVIQWAQKKMQEEAEARALAEKYPAVADALEHVRESQEQLKTVVTLCRT